MQVLHYKYATSVADVLLLSLFRAGPGTWVLWTLRERRRDGRKALLSRRQQQQPNQHQQAKQEDGGSAAGGGGSGGESSSPIRRRLTWTAAFMVCMPMSVCVAAPPLPPHRALERRCSRRG